MKNLTSHKVRSMFLLGGIAVMMGATMIVPQTARADTAQNYKTGATVLGVLGVVLAAKGKALPAIIAGAGAYYAYEKGKDAQNEERYNDRYNGYDWKDNRYDRNDYRYDSRNPYYDRYDKNDRYDRKDNGRWNDRYDSNNYNGNRYDKSNDPNCRSYDRNSYYDRHSYSVR